MKRRLLGVAQIALAFLVFSPLADAARLGTVQMDLQAMSQPVAGATVTGTIPQGELVTVGNNAVNGFVKVRSRAGVIGYVPESSIQITSSLPAAPQGPATPQVPTRSGVIQHPSQARVAGVKGGTQDRKTRFKKMQANVFGGFAYLSPSDLYDMLRVSSSKPGISFGVEGGYKFDKMFGVLMRVEKITKSILANDATGKTQYSVTLESLPIMAGGFMHLLEDPFTIDIAALVGLAMGTKASVISVQKASPNETIWAGSALTYMIKTDLNLALGKSFLLYAELGYRILSTSSFPTPTTVGNLADEQNFKTGSTYKAITLNFSGVFVGGGFGFRF